jgi:adenosine deaminase
LTKQKYVETVLNTISEFNASTGKMKAKLILSIDRRDDVEKAWETVELAKRYKNEGVSGVDLCGDPLVCIFFQSDGGREGVRG